MLLLFQPQGFQRHVKSESRNPADLALSNAQGLLYSGKVDKEGHVHAGYDRSLSANADSAPREVGDAAVTNQPLTGAYA